MVKLVYLSKEDWEKVSIEINTVNLSVDKNVRSFICDDTFLSDYQGYLVHKDNTKPLTNLHVMYSASRSMTVQNEKDFQ